MTSQVDFIYIIEDETQIPSTSRFNIHKKGYAQNYTIPGSGGDLKDARYTSNISASKKAALLLAASSLYLSPLGVLSIGTSVAALSKLFLDSSAENPDNNITKELAEAEVNSFLANHAITPEMAKSLSFNFPPGHPRVGCSYRLHPLAGRGNAPKENLYIPEDKFDELLFEEREAELIRLLVNLGATKISISENIDETWSNNIKGGLGANIPAAGGGASISSNTSSQSSGVRQREFVLNPVKSHESEKVSHPGYAWVDFEPSWQSLIFAREVGRCTKASIILKEKTAFSNNKNASANLSAKMVDANLSAEAGSQNSTDKNFVIEVYFYEKE
jgi:hypothetical protein